MILIATLVLQLTAAPGNALDPRLGLFRAAGGERLIVFPRDSGQLGIGYGAGEVRGLAGVGHFRQATSGQSSGSSVDVPFEDLAKDVLAAVAVLTRDPAIRPGAIGLFGTSQGIWVALQATTLSRDLAFLVLVSGGGTSPLDAELNRGRQTLERATQLTAAQIAAATAFRRRKFEFAITGERKDEYDRILAAARSEPWFKHIGDGLPNQAFWRPNGLFDPIPPLQAFRKPVLAMFGALDTNNDAARNAELMEAAWKVAGNPRGKAVVFERANHGLFETDHRIPLERELPSLTRFVPRYIDLLTRWLEEVAPGSSGGQ